LQTTRKRDKGDALNLTTADSVESPYKPEPGYVRNHKASAQRPAASLSFALIPWLPGAVCTGYQSSVKRSAENFLATFFGPATISGSFEHGEMND
jgi:hypothetical protein